MSTDESDFKVLVINRAKCLKCGDIITSEHRHDFKWCSCKSLAVDGGSAYIKRSFSSPDDYQELSENRRKTKEELQLDINRYNPELGEHPSFMEEFYREK